MTVKGMDVEAVQQLSTAIRKTADEFDADRQALTSVVQSVSWIGQDGDRFREAWNGPITQTLSSITQGMRDEAQRLDNEARSQLEASS